MTPEQHPLAKLWRATWTVVAGRGVGRTARQGRNVKVGVRVLEGPADCTVTRTCTRGWSVLLTCPADWATRVLEAGHALHERKRPRGLPGVVGIVLDYRDVPAGRELTVLERPWTNRNEWRVYVTTVPVTSPSPATP